MRAIQRGLDPAVKIFYLFIHLSRPFASFWEHRSLGAFKGSSRKGRVAKGPGGEPNAWRWECGRVIRHDGRVSGWVSIVVLVLAVLSGLFLLSSVTPRYIDVRHRRKRVEDFLARFSSYLEGDHSHEDWLIARAAEMQRDALTVRLGVTYVAPPPILGGGAFQPHQMFADLFNRQSFADCVTPAYKLEVLRTTAHELRARERRCRHDLMSPWSWVRLSFERVVGFPRYVLVQAGFSKKVTDSSLVRAVTVVWSLVVGAAGIGSFVLALIALRK